MEGKRGEGELRTYPTRCRIEGWKKRTGLKWTEKGRAAKEEGDMKRVKERGRNKG